MPSSDNSPSVIVDSPAPVHKLNPDKTPHPFTDSSNNPWGRETDKVKDNYDDNQELKEAPIRSSLKISILSRETNQPEELFASITIVDSLWIQYKKLIKKSSQNYHKPLKNRANINAVCKVIDQQL